MAEAGAVAVTLMLLVTVAAARMVAVVVAVARAVAVVVVVALAVAKMVARAVVRAMTVAVAVAVAVAVTVTTATVATTAVVAAVVGWGGKGGGGGGGEGLATTNGEHQEYWLLAIKAAREARLLYNQTNDSNAYRHRRRKGILFIFLSFTAYFPVSPGRRASHLCGSDCNAATLF